MSVSGRGVANTSTITTRAAADAQEAVPEVSKGGSGSLLDECKWVPEEGPALYKPETFEDMVQDATRCAVRAMEDGETRLEIDFPPLPTSINSYVGKSDDFIDANVSLALRMCQTLAAMGRKPRLVVPDRIELVRSKSRYATGLDFSNVEMGSLEESDNTENWVDPLTMARRGLATIQTMGADVDDPEELVRQAREADVHVILNISTVDLPMVRKYTEEFQSEDKKTAVILFNLELETLRGDLGQVTFPAKSMHYEFLTTFLPVFFLRRRDYSKTVSVAPFIVNYSGCLLRCYPAPWQAMLQQDDKSYACVAENESRYTLQQFKEELLIALGLDEEEGSQMEFWRRGFFKGTWWEVELEEEASDKWRK